jgi:hypothetical protein
MIGVIHPPVGLRNPCRSLRDDPLDVLITIDGLRLKGVTSAVSLAADR